MTVNSLHFQLTQIKQLPLQGRIMLKPRLSINKMAPFRVYIFSIPCGTSLTVITAETLPECIWFDCNTISNVQLHSLTAAMPQQGWLHLAPPFEVLRRTEDELASSDPMTQQIERERDSYWTLEDKGQPCRRALRTHLAPGQQGAL